MATTKLTYLVCRLFFLPADAQPHAMHCAGMPREDEERVRYVKKTYFHHVHEHPFCSGRREGLREVEFGVNSFPNRFLFPLVCKPAPRLDHGGALFSTDFIHQPSAVIILVATAGGATCTRSSCASSRAKTPPRSTTSCSWWHIAAKT